MREEIFYWLFLEGWDDSVIWRDERYVRVFIVIDVFFIGWGVILLIFYREEIFDYWIDE